MASPHYQQRRITIPDVGGPFLETTELPPWPGTSSRVRLDHAPDYVAAPVARGPFTIITPLLLAFSGGIALGLHFPLLIMLS